MNTRRSKLSQLQYLIFGVFIALTLTGCGGADTLRGKATWDGIPLANCTVNMDKDNGSGNSSTQADQASPAMQETTTNASGRYSFESVPPGKYSLILTIERGKNLRCSALIVVDVIEAKRTEANFEIGEWVAVGNSNYVVKVTGDEVEFVVPDWLRGDYIPSMSIPNGFITCSD